MRLIGMTLVLLVIASGGLNPALAQIPTGILAGRVTHAGTALPDVEVSVESPALQGTKTTATSISGDYLFRFLPPGEYTVRFVLKSFKTLKTTLKISATQTHVVDAEMREAAVSDEIVVTGVTRPSAPPRAARRRTSRS